MFQFPDRRYAAVFAVCLVLALPSCVEAAQSSPSRGPIIFRPFSNPLSLWSWLRNVWAKEGCVIDPSGKPACSPRNESNLAPASPTSMADAGCIIDPNGGPCGRQ